MADAEWEPCAGGPSAAAAAREKRYTVEGEECVFPASYLGQQLTNCTRLQAGQPEVCQASSSTVAGVSLLQASLLQVSLLQRRAVLPAALLWAGRAGLSKLCSSSCSTQKLLPGASYPTHRNSFTPVHRC